MEIATQKSRKKLSVFAWSVLGYNIAVVLWGAYVRASGSGAGCGRHWPLCNGEVVPTPKSIATVIEATHRVTSGVALLLVLALLVLALRRLPKDHRARTGAIVSMVCMVGEALLGAGLVLFELVAHDASMKRGLSMILHLCNTFVLLGALALTAWWITKDERRDARPKDELALPKRPWILTAILPLSIGSVLLLGASGAIAALGDTLFPASSLTEGLSQDLSPMAHAFLRLRVFHPVIALCAGVLVLAASGLVRNLSTSERAKTLSRFVTLTFVVQFMAGLLNLSLLAPVGMQLVHLLLADLTWIVLVLMTWEAWRVRLAAAAPAPSSPVLAQQS